MTIKAAPFIAPRLVPRAERLAQGRAGERLAKVARGLNALLAGGRRGRSRG